MTMITWGWHIRDIKTHKLVRYMSTNFKALEGDNLSLVEDIGWATGWASKNGAAAFAGLIMDDFSPNNPLAGASLEIVWTDEV